MKITGVVIKFSDGKRYLVPNRVIAEHRANYYADSDKYEINSDEWIDQYKFAINDNYMCADWIANNMDWSDVKDEAIDLGGEKEVNYDDEFLEQDFEITTIELD